MLNLRVAVVVRQARHEPWRMRPLRHFTAGWAETICGPHREEVQRAAQALETIVIECNIDERPDLATSFGVLNVPAVALDDDPSTLLTGARRAAEIVSHFRGGRP